MARIQKPWMVHWSPDSQMLYLAQYAPAMVTACLRMGAAQPDLDWLAERTDNLGAWVPSRRRCFC